MGILQLEKHKSEKKAPRKYLLVSNSRSCVGHLETGVKIRELKSFGHQNFPGIFLLEKGKDFSICGVILTAILFFLLSLSLSFLFFSFETENRDEI